jgi:hypothetical protein
MADYLNIARAALALSMAPKRAETIEAGSASAESPDIEAAPGLDL